MAFTGEHMLSTYSTFLLSHSALYEAPNKHAKSRTSPRRQNLDSTILIVLEVQSVPLILF